MTIIEGMKISELPEPYRSLARLRETQREYRGLQKGCDVLCDAFSWGRTPEGGEFWFYVAKGKHAAIPEISLAELDQIMTIEEIAAMPGSYTMPGFTPGNLYAFWDGEDPQEWLVARYSHSERTTPFDRHWSQDKRYFAHMGHCLFTVGNKNLTFLQVVDGFEQSLKSREILAPEEGA
jgi:hypothetical protein